MDIFRLRLAYGRLNWKHVAVDAGQDWALFAPLNPTSLAGYAIPDFSASGNPWIRLPQVENAAVGLSPILPPACHRRARPHACPRIAHRLYEIQSNRRAQRPLRPRQKPSAPVDSWGVALDYSIPLSRSVTLSGEAFEGRALGIFSVTSGEAIGAPGTPGAHGVESRGGWSQLQFNPARQWQLNLAYGLEIANAGQLPVGNRWRDQTFMSNLIFKLTPRSTSRSNTAI